MGDGERFTRCGQGHVHWGRHGAAGLLVYHDGHVLLQRRAWWTPGGNTWALFGGARGRDEDPVAAALREAAEESTLSPEAVRVHGLVAEDHGDWAYHTVLSTADSLIDVRPASAETRAAAWVPVSEVDDLRAGDAVGGRWAGGKLYGPFAQAWPRLRDGLLRPVLIVDCANVMGARADGWWRDRKGAAVRLRDDLARVTETGQLPPFDTAYPELTLVVEGAARGIGADSTPVRVVDAPGSGDDTIVDLVSTLDPDARAFVITADRELRHRVETRGAVPLGPRWLLSQLSRG